MTQLKDAIEDTATKMLEVNRPITSAKVVTDAVKETLSLEVNDDLVREVMRKDMRLGYRQAKTVPIQANSERCLVLRQQYALLMLPLLESGCF